MNCVLLREQKGEIKMKRGFTLIELMIVMAVIAILVGIALPRFKGMREEANIAKADGELRALKTAVESYYIHQGSYPATTTTLCATYLTASTTKPKLIETDLYDPFGATSTTEYRYAVDTNGDYYVIWSLGSDKGADITGIDTSGDLTGSSDDDVFATNGSGSF